MKKNCFLLVSALLVCGGALGMTKNDVVIINVDVIEKFWDEFFDDPLIAKWGYGDTLECPAIFNPVSNGMIINYTIVSFKDCRIVIPDSSSDFKNLFLEMEEAINQAIAFRGLSSNSISLPPITKMFLVVDEKDIICYCIAIRGDAKIPRVCSHPPSAKIQIIAKLMAGNKEFFVRILGGKVIIIGAKSKRIFLPLPCKQKIERR